MVWRTPLLCPHSPNLLDPYLFSLRFKQAKIQQRLIDWLVQVHKRSPQQFINGKKGIAKFCKIGVYCANIESYLENSKIKWVCITPGIQYRNAASSVLSTKIVSDVVWTRPRKLCYRVSPSHKASSRRHAEFLDQVQVPDQSSYWSPDLATHCLTALLRLAVSPDLMTHWNPR